MIARALGTPLIPWQQYVADVAGERRPDGSYEHEIVIVTVPRQTGKTTLIRAVGTHSGLAGRDFFYTAQTGKDARARWYDLVKLLRVNPALKDRITVALRGGSEHVLFKGSGAVFQAFAPTPESLHGYTPPKVAVDEAFSQTGGRGELLMGAIGPAQFTIVDRQIWIVSTAGTAESIWFHDWVERGREGTDRVALFDWGATEDQNPYKLDDIAAFHPGVGFELNGKTLTAQDVLDELGKNTRAEYERAFANRRTLTLSHLVPAETWRALKATDVQPAPKDQCVLAYDVAFDRQSAAILALWETDAGKPCGMVLRHQAGTSWLLDELDALATSWRPRALAAVDSGPVLDTTQALVARGHVVQLLKEREYATACSAFLARIDDQAIAWHATEPAASAVLERSVTGLVTRSAAGDGVAFSRRHSVGDSSPAIAYTAGLHVLETQPAGKPEIYI